jgi:hypothetical protein
MKLVILIALPRFSSCGNDEDLAHTCVRDEDLGTIDQEVIALIDRECCRPPRIAAGTRFCETKTTKYPSGGEQRNMPPLLLLGTELDNRRGTQVRMRADSEGMTGIHLGHFMDRDVVRELIHTRAAELLAPGNAEQAELSHGFDVFPGESRCAVKLGGHWQDVRAGEVPNHLADLVVVFGEVEGIVHCCVAP